MKLLYKRLLKQIYNENTTKTPRKWNEYKYEAHLNTYNVLF